MLLAIRSQVLPVLFIPSVVSPPHVIPDAGAESGSTRGSGQHSTALFIVFCLFLTAAARGASFVSASEAPNATPSLLQELNRGAEQVNVIIGVKDGTPSAKRLLTNPDPKGEPERRKIRIASQKRLADEMTPRALAVHHYYESFSMLAATATRDAAIALASRPDVAWIDVDRRAHLLDSSPQSSLVLIRSDRVNSLGITGSGQTIAVIDTGVDYTVAALGGGSFPNAKVIGGTDIADNDSDPMDCDGHGTSVAAVIASSSGVAPDARIVAIKVFSSIDASNSSCKDTASFSDIFAGINYTILNKDTFGIVAINLSLGAGFDDSADHGYCDSDDPGAAASIDSATAAGLVVAVAAGNDGVSNQLADPACVSSAVSVGAVYADSRASVSWQNGLGGILCTDEPVSPDQIVCFSDSTTNLSLLAPGAFWNVVTKGGGPEPGGFSGTSASTPAVAGAVALLRQARPDLTPAGLIATLRLTGNPITDSRNGVVTLRIDTLAAVQLPAANLGVFPASAINIPDGTGAATATAAVSGFTQPIATVRAWAEINHPEPEQLRLTLIGPDGTSAVLRDRTGTSQHPINAIFGKTDPSAESLGIFAGKQANGVWTLKVEDLVSGATGSIHSFALALNGASSLFTVAPCRVADTRNAEGPSGGPALVGGTIRTFPVAGICGIPPTASAVALNLAVVMPSDGGDLRVFPAGGVAPLASSINFRPGIIRANNAIIALPDSGQISIQCDMPSGGTHFFFDVYGYFQ
jgi:subtilisin family serine protease